MKVKIKEGYLSIMKIQGLKTREEKYNSKLTINDGDIVEVKPYDDGKLIRNGFELINPKTKLDELSVLFEEDFEVIKY